MAMANEAPTGAESATSDPGVSLTEPVEVGEGINRENPKPNVEAKPEEKKPEGVDLKVWAKTSAENRALKASEAKLKADLEAAQKLSSPDAINAAVLEALKRPETIKLLKQSGVTMDQVADVFLVGDEGEDPKTVEQRKRIDDLEAKIKAKEEAETKKQAEATEKANAAAIESSLANINGYIDSNADSIDDEKDPRNGTPRWVLVRDDKPLIREAHDLVINFLVHNKIPEAKHSEIGKKLLEQALDKIEIREREKAKPKLEKFEKLKPVQKLTNKDGNKKTVVDTDWRPQVTVPTLQIDRSATSGPAPVKAPKKRFSSGPAQVKFTS